jgi:hypothetical protein
MYYNKFFSTKEEAKAFQKQQGYGVMYSYTKGSRTKRDYLAEAAMAGLDMETVEKLPYVVAWNG